jgi:Phage Terminase
MFLRYAFATGSDGRLLYPEQIYACPKKSGKTTFAAIYTITIVMLFGGHYPEAICAANDQEQSIGRVFAAIKRIIECSPLLRNEAKITVDKITLADAVISAIPSNYASAAGSNPVVTVFDELWAYDRERLRRLFDELVPPPTRRIACRLIVTYAGFEGESILLHELYKRGLSQPKLAPNLYAGDGILMFWSHDPVAVAN